MTINPPLLHSFFLVSIKRSDSVSQFPMPYSLGNVAALLTCWLKHTVTTSHLTSILSSLSWSSSALFRKSVRSGLRVFYFPTLQDLRTPRKVLVNWCLTDRVLPQSFCHLSPTKSIEDSERVRNEWMLLKLKGLG